MKNQAILLCLLGLSFFAFGQKKRPLSAIPTVTIRLKAADTAAPNLYPFRHFEVIDERPDTARIGIHTYVPAIGAPYNRQLVFSQPIGDEIAGYLNSRFTNPDGTYPILIVLRNLWLSDANYLREEKVKNPDIVFDRTHIRLKAEIYAIKDGLYVPVLRFDTLQTYKRPSPSGGNTWTNSYYLSPSYYSLWGRDLADMLEYMADSVSLLISGRIAHGRQLQREEILQFNRSRFDVRITADTSLTPGVYSSFQEFKDNAPSIHDFEIKTDKKDHLLYIKDANGTLYYSHDAWGYCDGKSVYIMRDGKLWPAWREGKGFYFYSKAYKEETVTYDEYVPATGPTVGAGGRVVAGNPGGMYPSTRKVTSAPERIYTVDMDSGVVY